MTPGRGGPRGGGRGHGQLAAPWFILVSFFLFCILRRMWLGEQSSLSGKVFFHAKRISARLRLFSAALSPHACHGAARLGNGMSFRGRRAPRLSLTTNLRAFSQISYVRTTRTLSEISDIIKILYNDGRIFRTVSSYVPPLSTISTYIPYAPTNIIIIHHHQTTTNQKTNKQP